ncbi:MAG: hypothetical protein HOW73_44020 [Polyangiaceae bacterium]|nr:hypothetical protein [Polyangiaceae bacterium]
MAPSSTLLTFALAGLVAHGSTGCGAMQESPERAREPSAPLTARPMVPPEPTLALAGAPKCTVGEASNIGVVSEDLSLDIAIAANRDGALIAWDTDREHFAVRRLDHAGRPVGAARSVVRNGFSVDLQPQPDGTFVLSTDELCGPKHSCLDVLTLDRDGVVLGPPARAEFGDRELSFDVRATARGALWMATPTTLTPREATTWWIARAIPHDGQPATLNVEDVADMPTEGGDGWLEAAPDGRWIVQWTDNARTSFAEKIEGKPARRAPGQLDFRFRARVDTGVTSGGPDGHLDGLLFHRYLGPNRHRTTLIVSEDDVDRAFAWTGERFLVAYSSGKHPHRTIHVVPVDCRPDTQ